jgi:iron-sulfur cluster repair protein YtfE (RIC family)
MPEVLTDSWARQVLDEHRELRLKVKTLREYICEPRPAVGEKGAHSWAANLASQLVNLHDELVRHFRFEDESGMVQDVDMNHPEASRHVRDLVDEHPKMLEELRRLMTEALDYSEGHPHEDCPLRRGVCRLLDQLERHEREENDLILKLETRDIGTKD